MFCIVDKIACIVFIAVDWRELVVVDVPYCVFIIKNSLPSICSMQKVHSYLPRAIASWNPTHQSQPHHTLPNRSHQFGIHSVIALWYHTQTPEIGLLQRHNKKTQAKKRARCIPYNFSQFPNDKRLEARLMWRQATGQRAPEICQFIVHANTLIASTIRQPLNRSDRVSWQHGCGCPGICKWIKCECAVDGRHSYTVFSLQAAWQSARRLCSHVLHFSSVRVCVQIPVG